MAGVHSTAVQTLYCLKRSLKLESWPTTMAIVLSSSKLEATLGRLSFGTHPLRRLKGAMQISVIGHPLEVPLQALHRYS